MKNKIGIVVLVIGAVLSGAACGGADEEMVVTDVTAQRVDPSCGNECPDDCWVDLATVGGNKTSRWFIFDADELPEQPLRDSVATLAYPGHSWMKELSGDIDDPVQVTVYAPHAVTTSGFDIYDSGMVATVVLGSPESPLTCGIGLDD